MTDWASADAFISTAPTTRHQRKLAALTVCGSLAAFCITAYYAQVQLPAVPTFIPLNQAAFLINDLITAVLLFAQVPHLRSRALLVLACGYAFDALMIVPHTLTFPGLFSAGGLLGASKQSTAWIYMFWHAGFPLFVAGYAMSRGNPGKDRLTAAPWKAIVGGLAGTALLACVLTMLAIAGDDALPPLMLGNGYTPWQRLVIFVTWLSSVLALACVYRRRKSSALDLWLAVVLCAWVFDVALSGVFNHARYDLGFYAGRAYGLVSASFVLIMLLVESSHLYARLRQSQQQLAHAQKMEAIGQLTGGIAHDFNNLLAAIQGGIELAERHIGSAEHDKLERFLGQAKRAVESGMTLTRGLLAFSRRQALAPRTIDINPLISGLAELLHWTLGSAIRIETAVAAPPAHCFVDPNQLEHALLNLAVNARDAMLDGGTLAIKTETFELDEENATPAGMQGGRYVVLSVSDTGTGMTPQVLARAFEPFFTTKPADSGTGLGLSQVYGFVQQSGGHTRIESRPGYGTTVRMFLPCAADQQTAAAARVPELASAQAGEPTPALPRRSTRRSRPSVVGRCGSFADLMPNAVATRAGAP